MISYDDFEKIDIRVGKIVEASLIEAAKYSTHRLKIFFGDEIGYKNSCARLVNYELDELIGREVLAVVNFPSKQIGKHLSEVLVLGVPDHGGECTLVEPSSAVPLGGKLY